MPRAACCLLLADNAAGRMCRRSGHTSAVSRKTASSQTMHGKLRMPLTACVQTMYVRNKNGKDRVCSACGSHRLGRAKACTSPEHVCTRLAIGKTVYVRSECSQTRGRVHPRIPRAYARTGRRCYGGFLMPGRSWRRMFPLEKNRTIALTVLLPVCSGHL